MNGKLRKVALGMSVLMCAGMLFTCALPAKAAMCTHPTLLYFLETFDVVDENHFDDEGHFIRRETRACCTTCGEILVMQSETVDYEAHDLVTEIYWNDNIGYDYCTECNYECTYIVLSTE